MRLPPEMWDALNDISRREGQTLRDIIQQALKGMSDGGRTSAVRVFVLQYFQAAATEAGHRAVGHRARGISAD